MKKKYTKIWNETLFPSFAKQLETLFSYFCIFFQFRETIETRWNSDLFRTVSYFAKLKKIRNCQPYSHDKDSFGSETMDFKSVLYYNHSNAARWHPSCWPSSDWVRRWSLVWIGAASTYSPATSKSRNGGKNRGRGVFLVELRQLLFLLRTAILDLNFFKCSSP